MLNCENSIAWKVYLRTLWGSLYRSIWSPLKVFLHSPPKLLVLITVPLASLLTASNLVQTHNNSVIALCLCVYVNALLYWIWNQEDDKYHYITLDQWALRLVEVFAGHRSLYCHIYAHLSHIHSHDLHCILEFGWYISLKRDKQKEMSQVTL